MEGHVHGDTIRNMGNYSEWFFSYVRLTILTLRKVCFPHLPWSRQNVKQSCNWAI